jgi:hypothetical protein
MTKKDVPTTPDYVSCNICLKEVPISEAVIPEASDYVAYYCGVDCYDVWRNQAGNPIQESVMPDY